MASSEDKLSADFTRVPVIDVHKDNLNVHLPGLLKAIEESSFVAIDCVRLWLWYYDDYWNDSYKLKKRNFVIKIKYFFHENKKKCIEYIGRQAATPFGALKGAFNFGF